jgi:hypothetical protein
LIIKYGVTAWQPAGMCETGIANAPSREWSPIRFGQPRM